MIYKVIQSFVFHFFRSKMGNGPEDLYLGRYNQQESLRVKIERFKAEVNKKRNTERRDPFNPPLPELKKEEYDPGNRNS